MIERLVARRGAVEVEDVVLVAWNLVAIPVGDLLADSWSSREPAPLLGLVEVAAVLLAIVAMATRPTGEHEPPTEFRVWILAGPLIGALGLVGERGVAHLGLPGTDVLLAVALLVGIGAIVLNHRLPVVDPGPRRLLVLPLVLLAAAAFQDIGSGILEAIDPGAFLASAAAGAVTPQDVTIAALIAGAVVFGAAVFFAMLVVAPRELADPEPRPSVWLRRFVLFLVSSLTGIGFWAGI
jgi:hypothetical protein